MMTHAAPEAAAVKAYFKPLKRSALFAWLCWLLSVGLLWVEHRMVVLHPYALVFLFLFAMTAISVLSCLVHGSWRLLRGPKRLRALGWLVFGSVPLLFWVGLASYSLRAEQARDVPRNLAWAIMSMAGASVMEAQAVYTYPHRLETEHLVMFYDERVTRPQRDADAMNDHVARLLKMTGRPLREKIYWVRGELIGRGRMAMAGLALGSSQSSQDQEAAVHSYPPPNPNLDRHELAHAVIHQYYEPDTDPPFLLVEGWAESQAGMEATTLASSALESRKLRTQRVGKDNRQSYLEELVSPSWYHRIGGPVYSVGGAFADHLLRTYGVEKFLELYLSCRQESFPADCGRVYGVAFETIEGEFWSDAESLARR